MSELQNHDRYRDFDQFWAEKKRVPVVCKIYGEEVTLPPAMPAAIMVRMLRLKRAKVAEVPDEEVLSLAEDLFTSARLDKWCAAGLDIEQLSEIINWVTDQYNLAAGKGQNPQGPGKGQK